ncbi:hypothetical protein [Cedecea lapagei]|uniref:hypothetical protein n=1 Tax=Cedecea lapagei TaxID=158823 RepID=UPI001BCAE90F|nr:hypothetical protein [Cedecea lapagei]
MINLIYDLASKAFDFFTRKQTVITETKVQKEDGQVQTNREEIQRSTLHWRNFLGFVITTIIAYNWLIVPLLDAFGIVVIQVPVGDLLRILIMMLGGTM